MSKSKNYYPVFPIPDPAFDPQITYSQVLEEARKQKRESSRTTDALQCRRTRKGNRRWWRTVVLFFGSRWSHGGCVGAGAGGHHRHRSIAVSAPLYLVESRRAPAVAYRTTRRPASGPIAGTFTPAGKGEVEVPYVCLRELNEQAPQRSRYVPIYCVT
ncbi:hypothetical protein NMG60_11025070 [Bertholletia excelsa]